MPLVGLEHIISAGERPKTYALEHAATGTGTIINIQYFVIIFHSANSIMVYITWKN